MNDDIKAMLARPGQYAISDAGFQMLHTRYVAVEVDADGSVHQLTPQGVRDGVLSADGWSPTVRVFLMSADQKEFTRIEARFTPRPDCPKCAGTGWYMYDDNHSTVCNLCCQHQGGWWQLSECHGERNKGKWCCMHGCGFIRDDTPPIGEQYDPNATTH